MYVEGGSRQQSAHKSNYASTDRRLTSARAMNLLSSSDDANEPLHCLLTRKSKSAQNRELLLYYIVEMNKPFIHVTIGESAAGLLRQGLRQTQSDDTVLAFPDNFSYGPIKFENVESRLEWITEKFARYHNGYWFPDPHDLTAFWKQYRDARDAKVIWFSRQSSREFCGFLECVYRAGIQDNILVNDLTGQNYRVERDNQSGSRRVIAASMLYPEEIIQFADQWIPLQSLDRERYTYQWSQLRDENSAFRILTQGHLASAPLENFDAEIVSLVSDKWRKGARIVGEAMGLNWQSAFDDHNDVGDLPLFARLNHLIDEGVVEVRGDRTRMRRMEVRRAHRVCEN